MSEKRVFGLNKEKNLKKNIVRGLPATHSEHESVLHRRKDTDLATPHIKPPPQPACDECQKFEKEVSRRIETYSELLSVVKEDFIMAQLNHEVEEDIWIDTLRKLQTPPPGCCLSHPKERWTREGEDE